MRVTANRKVRRSEVSVHIRSLVTSFRSVVPWAAQRGSHTSPQTSNAQSPPAKLEAYLNGGISSGSHWQNDAQPAPSGS
jgi:hypothetical protein